MSPKRKPDVASVHTGFSYLPFDFSRQLFSDEFDMSTGCGLSRHFLPTDSLVLCSTPVFKIASVVIAAAASEKYSCDSEDCCEPAFYAECVVRYHSMHNDIEDKELLVYFLKQMMILLRHCGIVSASDGSVKLVRAAVPVEALYLEIFNAFWSGVSWDSLFPSMPGLAKLLQDDRYVLVELLGARDSDFTVEEIARDYIEIMGVPCDDLLMCISFFDFSVFNWMSLFGVIRYTKDDLRVKAEMTEWGRSFLLAIE